MYLAELLFKLIQLFSGFLILTLNLSIAVSFKFHPSLVLLDLESSSVKLEILVLKLPREVRFEPINGF